MKGFLFKVIDWMMIDEIRHGYSIKGLCIEPGFVESVL